jgi:hypothetical protein
MKKKKVTKRQSVWDRATPAQRRKWSSQDRLRAKEQAKKNYR